MGRMNRQEIDAIGQKTFWRPLVLCLHTPAHAHTSTHPHKHIQIYSHRASYAGQENQALTKTFKLI